MILTRPGIISSRVSKPNIHGLSWSPNMFLEQENCGL